MGPLIAILPKLEDVLVEENHLLESHAIADHEPFIAKKNHLLRELMAVQRMLGGQPLSEDLRQHLRKLRALVATNHRLLGAQVAAMGEITNMLTAVALAEEADGTYSRHQ